MTRGLTSTVMPIVNAPQEASNGFAHRQRLIEWAKQEYNKHCDALLALGVAETFDAMSLSWFHSILMGDGRPSNDAGISSYTGQSKRVGTLIHAALARAQSMHDGGGHDATATQDYVLPKANGTQIAEVADFLGRSRPCVEPAAELLGNRGESLRSC